MITDYRYICSTCDARHGAPDRLGWIDIERCPACVEKGARHMDYAHKVYQPKEKPEGWRDGRRKPRKDDARAFE